MKKLKRALISAVTACTCACATLGYVGEMPNEADAATTGTSVHILNVSNLPNIYYGTSLSVLIQHNGTNILVDAGTELAGSPEIVEQYLKGQGVEKIDHMVLTHAHNDHAGGMVHQIEKFDVSNLYIKGIDWSMGSYGRTRVFYDEVYLNAQYKINSDGSVVNIVEPAVEGYRVQLDAETYFEIYNCTTVYEKQYYNQDYNYFSFMVKFTHKNASVLIGGDDGDLNEENEINRIGQCEVFVLRHHGTAGPYTTWAILDEVRPSYCVASGINQAVAADVISMCEYATGRSLMITGDSGHIVFDSNGTNLIPRS